MAEVPAPPCPQCGYPLSEAGCTRCAGAIFTGPGGERIEPGRGFAPLEFAAGFARLFVAGIELLTRREFFGALKLIVVANLIVVTGLGTAWLLLVHPMFVTLAEADWAALDLLRAPTAWSDATVATALTVTSFVLLAPAVLQTATAPFADDVAGAVERMMAGDGVRPAYRGGAWRWSLNVRASAQILAMQLLMLLPCLLLSFCGLGLPLALVAAGFLNALLWLETPFQRRGQSFDERLRVARHNWARTLGFGLAFQLGVFVPLFNLFLLAPAAVAAASANYLRMAKTAVAGAVRARP